MKKIKMITTLIILWAPSIFAQDASLKEMREIERNFEQILQELNNEVNNTTSEPLRLAHENFKDELNQCPNIDDLFDVEMSINRRIIDLQALLADHLEEFGNKSDLAELVSERRRSYELIQGEIGTLNFSPDLISGVWDALEQEGEEAPQEIRDSIEYEVGIYLENDIVTITGSPTDQDALEAAGLSRNLAQGMVESVRLKKRDYQENADIYGMLRRPNSLDGSYMIQIEYLNESGEGDWLNLSERERSELEGLVQNIQLHPVAPFSDYASGVVHYAQRWPTFQRVADQVGLLSDALDLSEAFHQAELEYQESLAAYNFEQRRRQLVSTVHLLRNQAEEIRSCRQELIRVYDSLQRVSRPWSSTQGVAELEESQSALRGVREAFEQNEGR